MGFVSPLIPGNNVKCLNLREVIVETEYEHLGPNLMTSNPEKQLNGNDAYTFIACVIDLPCM